MGGVVNSSGNPDAGSEPKNTSSGVSFNFIDVSIPSIYKFSKKLLKLIIKKLIAFSNFIILSNYKLAFFTFVARSDV